MLRQGRLNIEISKNLVRPRNEDEETTMLTREWLEENHPEVIEGLREGQKIAYEIFRDMGASKISGHESLPDRFSIGFDTSLCRAGESAKNSVVNSEFECHDIDNLFICDRSVPPCQASANVTMPLAMICNYAWRRIVAKHFSRV